MPQPDWTSAADRLRDFLAGQLPESESADVEDLLARDAIPEDVLRSSDSGDPVTEALRARSTLIEQAPDEESIVAELIQQIRQLRAVPVGETPRDDLLKATTILDRPHQYPFLRPAQESGDLGRLGPYRILSVLGEGGMGVVFRAEEMRLNRQVALKVIKPELAGEPEALQRFLREAQAAASLNHDHVVPIYQVGEDGETMYLAMPLLVGESLADRLAREGLLPVTDVLRIGREIAAALAAAHQHGLIHRDIKPGNIWLESPGGRVRLLDFGLARPSHHLQHLTGSGIVAGTPGYMAPEQVRGRPEPRSDLFSLGCLMYRMTTGEPPFGGNDTLEVLSSLANETPRPPREIRAEIPAALSRLIEKLLAKEAHHRPQTADQVILELEAIRHKLAAPAVGQAGMPPVSMPIVRGLILLGLIAVMTGLCVFILHIVRPDGTVERVPVPRGSTIQITDTTRPDDAFPADTPAAALSIAQWTVDDGDSGYSQSGTGWKQGTLKQGFQDDYHYNGKGAQTARWTVGPLPRGRYEVFLTWVQHPNRAFQVPITIFDGQTALGTILLNQRETPLDEESHGVGWKSLGFYNLEGDTLLVELDATRSKSDRTESGRAKSVGSGVSVDAVRVVARPESAETTPDHVSRKGTP